jgi:hypothetical protein
LIPRQERVALACGISFNEAGEHVTPDGKIITQLNLAVALEQRAPAALLPDARPQPILELYWRQPSKSEWHNKVILNQDIFDSDCQCSASFAAIGGSDHILSPHARTSSPL